MMAEEIPMLLDIFLSRYGENLAISKSKLTDEKDK